MPDKKHATMCYLLRENQCALALAARRLNISTAKLLETAAQKIVEEAGLHWQEQPDLRGKYTRKDD